MQSDEVFDLFRSDMADLGDPPLWTDADIYGYIDDAQKMFCRLTDGISDATTADVTLVEFAVDDDWVDLHPSILKIRTAYLVSDGSPVRVINQEDMEREEIRFDSRVGPVRRLIVGMEENKARLYPTASIADDLQLTVFRLPIEDIDAADQEFEIGAQHHRHLLLWCKHLAYLKQDAETLDRSKAIEFEQKFIAYCELAKREQQKKRHKIRTVAYGGI
jgi:hypothetical protein